VSRSEAGYNAPAMTRLVKKSALARMAGVSRMAVSKAAAGPLNDATHGTGRAQQVDIEHPLVVEWLAGKGVHVPVKALPDTPVEKIGPAPPPGGLIPGAQSAGGYDLSALEDLTVREVCMRYGSVDGFKRFIDSMKGIAEFKYRELRMQQQRGELVDRTLVRAVVFSTLNLAFQRLVSDIPDALGHQVIAIVEAGGEDVLAEVQGAVREANSRAIKNTKEAVMKLEVLNVAD